MTTTLDMLSIAPIAFETTPMQMAPSLFKSAVQPVQKVGSIAVVDVRGVFRSADSMIRMFFEPNAPNADQLKTTFQELAADSSIAGVMIRIDSPGGEAKQLNQLSKEVAETASIKPVSAYINGVGASAAYYMIAGASRISGAADALVGSIGTMFVITDSSQAKADLGQTVHVVSTGARKGDFAPGAPVSSEALADLQRVANEINDGFVEAVSSGRQLSPQKLNAILDGSIHVGSHAVDAGLMDAVESFETAMFQLATMIQAQPAGMASQNAHGVSPMPSEHNNRTISRNHDGHLSDAHTLAASMSTNVDDAMKQPITSAPSQRQVAPIAQPSSQPIAASAPAPSMASQSINETAIRQRERDRIDAINGVAQTLGMDDAWRSKMISTGVSEDQARQEALAVYQERNIGAIAAQEVTVGVDRQLEDLASGISDAVCMRTRRPIPRVDQFGDLSTDDDGAIALREPCKRSSQFRGRSLCEMARMYLDATGHTTEGMTRLQIAHAVFNPQASMPMMAGGSFLGLSSSDFPSILADTINKQAQVAFRNAPSRARDFVRIRTASDFKQISSVQVGLFGTLPAVQENGEYTMATFGDSKEVYTLVKYGEKFIISWESLVNDDLNIFSSVPTGLAAAARTTEDKAVFDILNDNPTMADSNALFDAANHSNTQAATNDLTVDGIGIGRQLMRDQTDAGGVLIDSTPSFIITGSSLETKANKVIGAPSDISASNNITPNPFTGLRQISSARLTTDSGKAWFLVADSASIGTIELAFLEGQDAPQIVSQDSLDIDGRQYRVRHVFGHKAVDWRGMVKFIAP